MVLLALIKRWLALPLHWLALFVSRQLLTRGDPFHGYLALSRLFVTWRAQKSEAMRFEPHHMATLRLLWANLSPDAKEAIPVALHLSELEQPQQPVEIEPHALTFLKIALTTGVHKGNFAVTSPSKVIGDEVETLETVRCDCGLLVDCDVIENIGGCPACGSRITLVRNHLA